jgi:UDP-N-acetyl-D-glucosamine dehydrogenase
LKSESPHLEKLLAKLDSRSARVGVVGLGYVGLPIALVFAEAGLPVLGFDIDLDRPEMLSRGESYIRHIDSQRVRAAFAGGGAEATAHFERLAECDAVLLCVPTPLGAHREPDLSFVRDTAEVVAAHLRPGQLVVLVSTTYPGTTREELLPRLAQRGLRCGEDFFLAYSPEREDPGNTEFATKAVPKLVGGVDSASARAATALYTAAFDRVVPVSTVEVAEAAKLLENVFRAVNVALVNELKVVLDRMGIDIWEVSEAAKSKPFGYMPFYPGPGLGGHCIPLDPFYLTWKAAEHGVWARFVELAGESNSAMPRYVVQKTIEALNSRARSVRGARILVLGLSYKPDIGDDRESPSYEILSALRALGAQVAYCDPFLPSTRGTRRHDLVLASVACGAEEFARHDVLVVSTAHTAFKDPALYAGVGLVVDCRNIVPSAASRTIVKA